MYIDLQFDDLLFTIYHFREFTKMVGLSPDIPAIPDYPLVL